MTRFLACAACLLLVAAAPVPTLPELLKIAPPREIWVVADPGAADGNGTQNSPRKATNVSQFEAILNSINYGALIHLGPGTFQKTGASMLNGRIVGAGVGKTTVQLVGLTAGYGSVFLGAAAAGFCEVGDMTIDCNFAHQPGGAPHVAQGIALLSRYTYVHDVEVKNQGSTAGEIFSVCLGCGPDDVNGVGYVERATVRVSSDYAGGHSCIAGGAYGTVFFSHCSVLASPETRYVYGYCCVGNGKTYVTDCTADGAAAPVHADTSGHSQMIVRNCRFTHVGWRALNIGAPGYPEGVYHDYQILGCYFGLDRAAQLMGFQPGMHHGLFAGNKVEFTQTEFGHDPAYPKVGWTGYPETSGIVVRDNRFGPYLTFTGASGPGGWTGINNRTLDGKKLIYAANTPLAEAR